MWSGFSVLLTQETFNCSQQAHGCPDDHENICRKQQLGIYTFKPSPDMDYHEDHQSDYRQCHHHGKEYTKCFISHNMNDLCGKGKKF